MISRRSIIGGLLSMTFLGFLFGKKKETSVDPLWDVPVETPPPAPLRLVKTDEGFNPEAQTIYRGYQLRWTGWKPCQSDERIVGQWIGYPIFGKDEYKPLDYSRPLLVSSIPGQWGPTMRGACFNIHVHEDQILILLRTKPAARERERRRAWKKLQKMIDKVMDSDVRNLSVSEWNEFFGPLTSSYRKES